MGRVGSTGSQAHRPSAVARVPDTREIDHLEREYKIWSKTMEGHSGTTPYNSYAGASAAIVITGAIVLDGALKWAQRRWRLSSSTDGDRAARHVYEDWAKAGPPFGASNSGTRSSSVRYGRGEHGAGSTLALSAVRKVRASHDRRHFARCQAGRRALSVPVAGGDVGRAAV